MQSEHGDAVWILNIVPTASEAWLTEQLVAYKYGIPQSTWDHSNVTYGISELRAMYEALGDSTDKARMCLQAYGRDIDYPFFRKGDLWKHFSKLHLFEVYVGNLIPKLFDIVVPSPLPSTASNPSPQLHNTYEQIMSIEPCPPELVYGLSVSDYHNYVGDGILTHNCIYGFRNADSSIIKQLSIDPEWRTVRLSQNYRSTVQICGFANQMSTYADNNYRIALEATRQGTEVKISSHHWQTYDEPVDDGTLREIQRAIETECEGSVAILARTNREVSYIVDRLESKGVTCWQGKRNEEASYLLQGATDNQFLMDWVATFLPADKYSQFIRKQTLDENYAPSDFFKDFGKARAVNMRVSTVSEIRKLFKTDMPMGLRVQQILKLVKVNNVNPDDILNVEAVNSTELTNAIIGLIQNVQDNGVYVGTIHSAKGLEYNNVFVVNVGQDKIFPLNSEEACNLYYVAITRAKDRLTIFTR